MPPGAPKGEEGKKLCGPLGERKIGAEPAIGYKIRGASKDSLSDLTEIHIWLSRSTGLPLAHGMGSDSDMLRWVYGPEVVAPGPDKIRK